MDTTKRPITKSEIERVYDLLGLLDREKQDSFRVPEQGGLSERKRSTGYSSWISNNSEPIKVGKARHAQLEGLDR